MLCLVHMHLMTDFFFHFMTFVKDTIKPKEWSKVELKGLVQYVALYNESRNWPTHKQVTFWDKCASSVAEFSGLPPRTGTII